jgi:glutaredoxin
VTVTFRSQLKEAWRQQEVAYEEIELTKRQVEEQKQRMERKKQIVFPMCYRFFVSLVILIKSIQT